MKRLLAAAVISLAAAPILPANAFEKPVSSATVTSCVVPNCDAVAFVVAAIDGAQQEIRGQSYDFTSLPIATALVRAKQRGVDVAMLFDKSTPCERSQMVDKLVQNRIAVAMDVRPRVANNKVLVIDNARVIAGSFDFTTVASFNTDNTNMISEPSIARYFRTYWDERHAKSIPYDGNRTEWCAREQR